MIQQIFQTRVGHQVAILIRRSSHIHHRDLKLLLPLLITDVEGRQLITSIAQRVEDKVIQLKEGGFGVDLKLSLEEVILIGEH